MEREHGNGLSAGKQGGKIPSGIQEAKLLASRKSDINIYQGLSGGESRSITSFASNSASLPPPFLLHCHFF